MNTHFKLGATHGLVFSTGTAVWAQVTVGKPVLVTPSNRYVWYGETVIGVSAKQNNGGNYELVVAFNALDTSTADLGHVSCSVSMNSGKTWSAVQELGGSGLAYPCIPTDGYLSFDPMIAESTWSGDVWAGAVAYAPLNAFESTSRCYVMRKPFGSASITDFAPVVGNCFPIEHMFHATPVDKGLMAAGPQGPGTSAEKLFVNWTFNELMQPTCGSELLSGTSTSAIPGQSFNPIAPITDGSTGPCGNLSSAGFVGHGTAPAIIRSGQAAGRIVVTYQPSSPSLPTYTHLDAGLPWSAPAQPISLTATSEQLSIATHPQVPGGFKVFSFPSVAVDPTDPLKVYIAFAATGTDANNPDIVISQSVDGGVTFDQNHTYRLSDSLLHELPGPTAIQFMPAICVDRLGKINLLYYHISLDDIGPGDPLMDAYYARLSQFPPMLPNDVVVQRLTAQSFNPRVAPITPYPQTPQIDSYLGDYNWITTAGCYVWVSYMATVNGTYGIYVHRITINQACVADANVDTIVNPNDITAFANALSAGSDAADVNADGQINAQDAVDFMNAYIATAP